MNEIMVSIICLTYNHEKYVRQTLDGFINQKTNFKFEVLVHDDASTDNTAQIIREYEKKYPDIIKPIYQTENQYSQKTPIIVTYQYPRAKGKYFAFCEGDDYWCDENKLQMQFDALENSINCTICVHDVRIIREDGEYTDSVMPSANLNQGKFSTSDILSIIADPKIRWPFQTSSFMVNGKYAKNLCENTPEYMKNAPVGDVPLMLHMISHGDVIYINKEMSCYRKDAIDNWTHRNAGSSSLYLDYLKKIADVYKKYNSYTNNKYSDLIDKIIFLHQIDIFMLTNEFPLNDFFRKILKRHSEYFSKLKFDKKKIAIWGNSIFGRNMCVYLERYGVTPDYIIDSNPAFNGTYYDNRIPVMDFEKVKNDCDVIIIAIRKKNIFEKLKKQINIEKTETEVLYFMELFLN